MAHKFFSFSVVARAGSELSREPANVGGKGTPKSAKRWLPKILPGPFGSFFFTLFHAKTPFLVLMDEIFLADCS